MPVAVIFGNGNARQGSAEYENAEIIGRILSKAGFGIATGAYGGVMEAALKGAAENGVERAGVTALELKGRKVNPYVTKVIETHTYLHRLEKLLEIGSAYVILPGGPGTLLEFSAAFALKKKGLMDKPIVALGDIWKEIISLASVYSESLSEAQTMISWADSPENAAEIIKHLIKKNGPNP